MVGTIPMLGKEWRVTFQVTKSIKYDKGLMNYTKVKPAKDAKAQVQNVLHLRVSGFQNYEDGTPGVWIHPEKGIKFSYAVNGTHDHGFYCRLHKPEAGIWTRYEVSQVREEEGEYFFAISINGKEVHRTVNTRPEVFANVDVFASNPWDANPESQASLRNLKIESEVSGT